MKRAIIVILILLFVNINAFAIKQEKQTNFYILSSSESSFFSFYKNILENDRAILLSSDFLFYIQHLFVDYSLRYTENKYLIDYYNQLLIKLIKKINVLYGHSNNIKIIKSKDKILEYLYVALKLLDDSISIPEKYKANVNAEIMKINDNNKQAFSEIFLRLEDYTQYKPRGHYSDNKTMSDYFKSMMWFQRMRFPIRTNDSDPYVFTRSILMLCEILNDKEIYSIYTELYSVISFYLAQSDDLLIIEVRDLFNAPINENTLIDQELLERFIDKVKENDNSKILSDIQNDNENKIVLIGIMGQRYIFDSEVFTNLVYDKVGIYMGDKNKKPFTLVGTIRGFPRGLDLMYVLGSDKAFEIMQRSGDIHYIGYNENIKKMKELCTNIKGNNMYERILLQYITLINSPIQWEIMKNEYWKYKELNTLLASWAMLRHDVILYAKQSYTLKITSAKPIMNDSKYIIAEPYIGVYMQMKNDIDYLSQKLFDFSDDNLYIDINKQIKELIQLYIDISNITLKNNYYNNADYILMLLNNLDRKLKMFIQDKKNTQDNTVMIADVHTEPNSKMVLEEATGFVHTIMLEKDNIVFKGGVIPYYEFKQSMRNRLNDEQWREILKQSDNNYFDFWQEYIFENSIR